mmetsp:Transcript_108954/g.307047  ORF Transcript_108954/g.307047 Transcript_108954/m.307047 type:complete len:285 (-) Transcript_108954:151-1005(-)
MPVAQASMYINVHVRDRRSAAQPGGVQVLMLRVVEEMRVPQLRNLITLQLATRGGGTGGYGGASRPQTAPARAGGGVATSLAAAAAGYAGGATPIARRTQESLTLRLVFEGQVLGNAVEEQSLAALGVTEGAVLHCIVSPKADGEQNLSCYPHSCSTDGGRVVHVLGQSFPPSSRTVCRFGTILVEATVEDDGDENGVAKLVCTAPPHPAGPVTLSVSFDSGAQWLGGPTFWFVDPSTAGCPFGIAVPAMCRGSQHVTSYDATFGHSGVRWDNDNDRDPGAGCV